jgi:chromate transporter
VRALSQGNRWDDPDRIEAGRALFHRLVAVLTALFELWRDSPIARAAIHGAVAAAVGITVKTCWTIARPYFKRDGRLRVLLVGGAAFVLSAEAGIPPIEVLILAAVIG